MAVNSLHKSCPNFPSFSGELPDSIVCAPGSRSCWLNECHACKDADIFKTKYKLDNTSESATTWYVWKSDQDNKLCKAVEEGTTQDLFNHISSLVPQSLRHCFIKRMQAEYYQKQREAITSEQVIVQLHYFRLIFQKIIHVYTRMRFRVPTSSNTKSVCLQLHCITMAYYIPK